MLNWALMHGDQQIACPLMQKCTCSTMTHLACSVCSSKTGSPLKLTNPFTQISEGEDADDEDNMLSTLNMIAHRVRKGPKPHQRGVSRSNVPKPLTRKQLDWIVAQVKAGKIDLPNLDALNEDDFTMVWALADTGSAAHVADMRKQFPGASIRESEAQRRGVQYVGATGDCAPNRGEADITFITPDGQSRVTTFQNASVGMPILSISKVTDEGNDVLFGAKGGYIEHLATGQRTPLVKRLGVYFVQLKVPKKLAEGDFGRPAP